MADEFKPKIPENTMEIIWIAVLGKLLVQKGVLSQDEVISELQSFRRVFAAKPQTVSKKLICIDIDNAVQTVQQW